MVKHPLQNLGASSGPSGSKNVMRTHTRLRLVQKTQLGVTHKHTVDGISAAGMHMDFTCFFGSLRAASQGTQPFDVLQREAQHGQQTLNPRNISHPHW